MTTLQEGLAYLRAQRVAPGIYCYQDAPSSDWFIVPAHAVRGLGTMLRRYGEAAGMTYSRWCADPDMDAWRATHEEIQHALERGSA